MLGTMTVVFERAADVFMVAGGLGCVWLGCWALLRPRRPPETFPGPVWVVRARGLGFVLLGISLAAETVTRMTGGEPGWTVDVIRWVAGPLVVGSMLAAFVIRRRERHRARAQHEGRQA
jgi:hypothetical protein